MHVQIINFSLNDLTHDAYSDAWYDIAETFANLPGLISKHWIANPETNTYGGVYFWESKEDMENYLKSEVFEEVANNPAFADATSKDFAILEGPTRTTRGITWASDGVRTRFEYSPINLLNQLLSQHTTNSIPTKEG